MAYLNSTVANSSFSRTYLNSRLNKSAETKSNFSDKNCSKQVQQTQKLSQIVSEPNKLGTKKVTFCQAMKAKNKTICECLRAPMTGSLYEIFDLMAFVFNVQICLLEFDQIGGHLNQIYFGSGQAEFKFHVLRSFRLGSKLAVLRAKLQKLLEKSRKHVQTSNEERTKIIEDRLRRIEDEFGDFRNFSFTKLSRSKSQKRRMMSQSEGNFQTHATIKTVHIFSSLENVRKGGNLRFISPKIKLF